MTVLRDAQVAGEAATASDQASLRDSQTVVEVSLDQNTESNLRDAQVATEVSTAVAQPMFFDAQTVVEVLIDQRTILRNAQVPTEVSTASSAVNLDAAQVVVEVLVPNSPPPSAVDVTVARKSATPHMLKYAVQVDGGPGDGSLVVSRTQVLTDTAPGPLRELLTVNTDWSELADLAIFSIYGGQGSQAVVAPVMTSNVLGLEATAYVDADETIVVELRYTHSIRR